MSGVIDEDGQQWEHCNCCGKFVRIENLGNIPPGKVSKYPNGVDICLDCTNRLSQRDIYFVVPANGWTAKYGKR